MTAARSHAADELPRVLVVDDQAHNRRLLEVILAGEGVVVEMAASGAEALAAVARRPPDLILLDVMMTGMSGYEVASAIKDDPATTHIPIVMVTALDDHESMMLGLRAGVEEFLSKPVDRAELCLRVRSLLRLKAYGDRYGRYSEQLEAEVASRTAELRRAEAGQLLAQRLSLATAVARVGVWEWDLASDSMTWDATLFEIYGRQPVESFGYEHWAEAVCREDLPAVEETLDRIIAEQGEGAAEFRIVRPDGSIRDVAAIMRAVLDERMQVSRVIGVGMDITERKAAAGALERSRQEQLRFKDEFLSHVSHELRSPLTATKQFTSILLGGLAGELSGEQRQYLQIVLKNINQLQSMIDDLLEVSRLESGRPTVEPSAVSVHNAVGDALETMEVTARAKRIALSSDLPADLPSGFADRRRLRQVLIILLDNAVKFTPEGGAVEVRARPLGDDQRFLQIEVSDTGCGVHPRIVDRIFDRLYQAAEPSDQGRKGLGLGLHICKELVTRQGGQIRVDARPGGGSTFSFTLPVFSLRRLIAPLISDGAWPAGSAALLTIHCRFGGAVPSREARASWLEEVRGIVRSCLLPDLDALLPIRSSEAQGERLFVVAFTDEHGVSVMVNRLRQQFERCRLVWEAGVSLSVSHEMLRPFPREVGASAEAAVANVAAQLDTALGYRAQLEIAS